LKHFVLVRGRGGQPAARSIHPQGWVPIETPHLQAEHNQTYQYVAFTPKGGCPLKQVHPLEHRVPGV